MSYQSAIEKLHGLGLHSLVVSRDGQTVAEASVKPYGLDQLHPLFSLTKSFTSTAVGFAVQEGLLSLDDKLVSFFPERQDMITDEKMRDVTVRHLLTMSTGHKQEPDIWPDSPDPPGHFLRTELAYEPGSVWLYNSAASGMLGYIVEKVSGMSMEAYLRPRLFDPLGIAEWVWDKYPDDTCIGGYGLNLRTRDVLKFGNFMLYEGKQLLCKHWVNEATSKQILQPGNPGQDDTVGYGFQFWMCLLENAYRGDGAFGQICLVVPRRKVVVAMNSGSSDMGEMLRLLFRELLDGLDGDFPFFTKLDAPAEECKMQRYLRQAFNGKIPWSYKGLLTGVEFT
jgi:CubicO group peptidase (beta-lactamase class C family)